MNEPRGRRPLRTTLAGWLRALFRRSPPESDPEQPADTDRPDAAAAAFIQEGAGQAQTGEAIQLDSSAGGQDGPPEHWLAVARSKGPPQHWLDLIRARLGNDISKVRWIRGRALPPQTAAAALPTPQSLPALAKPAAPATGRPVEDLVRDEEKGAPFSPDHAPVYPAAEALPAPLAERRPPAAMRMYPAQAVEQPQPVQPRPAPLAQSQPVLNSMRQRESAAQPATPAGSRRISLTEARASQPAEASKPPHLPPAQPRPVEAQLPAPAAPERPPQTADKTARALREPQAPQELRAAPEPVMRKPGKPVSETWPAWQGATFNVPLVFPEPPAAAQKRTGGEPLPTAEPSWPPPPAGRPVTPPQVQPAASPAWPDRARPAVAAQRNERDLPANPAPAERWPALEQAADEDLAGDEWENYQRDWLRLERLRREQQGQLWSEWPF